MGLFLSMRVYNTFILPTLLFIAQLQHPPDNTMRAETKARKSIAAGPKAWCSMEDLQHLKDMGAPTEVRALSHSSDAAMMRTALWENSPEGGIPWAEMQYQHQYLMSKTDYVTRSAKQADWHRSHMASTVQHHMQHMKAHHKIDKHSIRQDLTKAAPLPLKREEHLCWKKKTQSHIHNALRTASTYNTTEKLRAKLHKWKIPGFPRIHAARCQTNLKLVMSHLAPRLGLTCWHTVLKRWMTSKRMGKKGHSCLLGCTEYDDSLEHYTRCKIAREWAATRLQLYYDHRNSLHTWTLTAHFPCKEDLFKTAFMIYATYRATNHFRHYGTSTDPLKQQEEMTPAQSDPQQPTKNS